MHTCQPGEGGGQSSRWNRASSQWAGGGEGGEGVREKATNKKQNKNEWQLNENWQELLEELEMGPESFREKVGSRFFGLLILHIVQANGGIVLTDRIDETYEVIDARQLMLQIINLDTRR